jgi:type II secretory pathway component PulF
VRDLALSRYSRIFGIALKAGMPIFQAAGLRGLGE